MLLMKKDLGYISKESKDRLTTDGRRLKADSFLKNEATDLLENKGSRSEKTRNEATV